MPTIQSLLKKLNWSVYRFMKESGIPKSQAYNIACEEFPDSASTKLARLWLIEKLKEQKP